MTTDAPALARPTTTLDALPGAARDRYATALKLFMAVVLAHWAEHLVQAWQVWVLGWPRHHSRGVLGQAFPWLVHSEALHYGYAVVMLAGLFLLRGAFTGRAGAWWMAAFWLQVWHHFEHLLLIAQATLGTNLAGRPVPTSVVQLFVPRIELHLFYNTVVFVPMVVALVLRARRRN
ncbi:MAG TPA: hypothetical protein VF746_11065 [Longimicrobium sp.]|jgi:hypothetical protein